MVGGIVIGVTRNATVYRGTRLYVEGVGNERHETRQVWVDERKGRPVEVGDTVWWRGAHCFWTPQRIARLDNDQILKRFQQGIDWDIALRCTAQI